jgi:uncharacterized membrane protein
MKKTRSKLHESESRNRALKEPNWLVFTIALLGLVVTGLLFWGSINQTALPYCNVSSGCDLIQNSAWSQFLGLPLAAWGVLVYAMLLTCSLGWLGQRTSRKVSVFVVSASFFISCYLTAVGYFYLHAFCQYCLISLVLIASIFIISLWNNGRRERGWFYSGAMGAIFIVVIMQSINSDIPLFGSREDPELTALANHLSQKGFKFYGASWCNACQEQKKIFGRSSKHLPYVECAKYGPNGPSTTECQLQEIRNYPTWIINSRRFEYVLTVDRLKGLSGFRDD